MDARDRTRLKLHASTRYAPALPVLRCSIPPVAPAAVAAATSTIPPPTATAATAAVAAAAAATLRFGSRLVHGEISTFERGAIHGLDGFLRLLGRAHGDEAESARPIIETVHHDVGFHHCAVGGESVLQVIFRWCRTRGSQRRVSCSFTVLCLGDWPLHFPNCSRPPGFKSSLNCVQLKIHHDLEALLAARRVQDAPFRKVGKRGICARNCCWSWGLGFEVSLMIGAWSLEFSCGLRPSLLAPSQVRLASKISRSNASNSAEVSARLQQSSRRTRPKPWPYAGPLATHASVRHSASCFSARRITAARSPSTSNFHPTSLASGNHCRSSAMIFGSGHQFGQQCALASRNLAGFDLGQAAFRRAHPDIAEQKSLTAAA